MRMSPLVLSSQNDIYLPRLKTLMKDIKMYNSIDEVPSDALIMFPRKRKSKAKQREYAEHMKKFCIKNKVDFVVSMSIDTKKAKDSNGSFVKTEDPKIVDKLDHAVREPTMLIFFPGAIFEATSNTSDHQNAQTMLLYDVPSKEQVQERKPISMWAAPPGSSRSNQLKMSPLPARDDLISNGWKEVKVGFTRNDAVVQRGPLLMHRSQYTLIHPNASTINKQMGCTIKTKCVIEVSFCGFKFNIHLMISKYSHSFIHSFIH